jgi:hypothetical protein
MPGHELILPGGPGSHAVSCVSERHSACPALLTRELRAAAAQRPSRPTCRGSGRWSGSPRRRRRAGRAGRSTSTGCSLTSRATRTLALPHDRRRGRDRGRARGAVRAGRQAQPGSGHAVRPTVHAGDRRRQRLPDDPSAGRQERLPAGRGVRPALRGGLRAPPARHHALLGMVPRRRDRRGSGFREPGTAYFGVAPRPGFMRRFHDAQQSDDGSECVQIGQFGM